MSLAEHHRRVISGESRGPLGIVERAGLRAAEVVYRFGVGYRNRAFDQHRRETVRLGVPVISIGNITVGGTGKTPTAVWICKHLLDRACRPAILSRGYKAEPGQPSDESRVIARHLADLVCISDPDRVAAGRVAIQKHGADVLVLDDGFQHRRLHRDLDVVLIDATCPFGYDHLLPRGLLRESLDSVARADLVIITRSDQVDPRQIDDVCRRIEQEVPPSSILRSVHKPTGFVDLEGRPIEPPPAIDQPAFLFAAVGNPRAFERSAGQVGVRPAGHHWWPDHHRYRRKDVEFLARQMTRHQATLLLTTEKDAVKLCDLNADWPVPPAALRVEIDFPDADQRVLRDSLDRLFMPAGRNRTDH